MNDRAVNLLEQYEIEVLKTRKGRGAILCDTAQGCLILKEYTGNEERLESVNRLLTHLHETLDSNKSVNLINPVNSAESVQDDKSTEYGNIQVESIIPNKEGNLFVRGYDGVMYILKTYAEGRECNINDRDECLDSVRLLAKLHSYMEFTDGGGYFFSPGAEYEKRNRELKRVRRYLKQRSQKTWFEIRLQQNFDFFMDQASTLTQEWAEYEKIRNKKADSGQNITYCHGDYQYHNLIKTTNGWFIINFEKCMPDDPVRDLYLLMRKLLEKSNWSVTLGRELLTAYEEIRPLSALSRIDLYYRLAYPEKFWKIVNFYYNSGKAWIPGRNLEKLEKVVEQEKDKRYLLDTLFGEIFDINKA